MTPEENVALLARFRAKAASAAPACAMAMGRTHEHHLVWSTLARTGHPPVTQTPSAPGEPPAVMTGRLRNSVTCVRGVNSGSYATTLVGPHTVYAATQEWGDVHRGTMWLWVKYVGPAEVKRRHWVRDVVDIPPRPYMRPSRDEVIASGAVTRTANMAFVAHVWG